MRALPTGAWKAFESKYESAVVRYQEYALEFKLLNFGSKRDNNQSILCSELFPSTILKFLNTFPFVVATESRNLRI